MLIFTVFLKKKIYAFEKSYICFTMQITKASQLTGVFPAIFTPLCSDDPKNLRNSVDFKKMGQMIDDLIASGVTGILDRKSVV